jgi:hypothetical protein
MTALYPKVWGGLHLGGIGTTPREFGGIALPHRSYKHYTEGRTTDLAAAAARNWRYATATELVSSLTGPWNFMPRSAGLSFMLRRLVP